MTMGWGDYSGFNKRQRKQDQDCLSCHHLNYCRSDEAYAKTCVNNNRFLYYEAHTKKASEEQVQTCEKKPRRRIEI